MKAFRCAISILVLLVFPVTAEAHLNTTGLGPVYDGLLHFLLSPEDLVPVIALALFAGLRGTQHGRRIMFAVPAAWLVGGVLGLSVYTGGSRLLPAISFVLLGTLVAADVRVSASATTLVAVLLGLFHGLLNGGAMGNPVVGLIALLGLVAAVFVIIVLVAALVFTLRPTWTRIAVRVVGSWIAACGLLLIGWATRGG